MKYDYTRSLLQKQIDFNKWCLDNLNENKRAVKSRIKDNKELQSAIEVLKKEGEKE